MRQIRTVSSGTLLLLTLLLLSSGPSFAGPTTLEVERRYYLPGEVAKATAAFPLGIEATVELEDGPFFAYLLPSGRRAYPWEIVSAALPVARVHFDEGEPEGDVSRSTIEFTVPAVPSGRYTIALCNRPCRSNVVGEIPGAWIRVLDDRGQGRLEAVEEDLSAYLEERVSRLEERIATRLDSLDLTAPAGRGSRESVRSLEERIASLEARDAQRVESLRLAQLRQRPGDPSPWAWLAGWLVAATIAGAWRFSSRRRPTRPGTTAREETVARVDLGDLSAGGPDGRQPKRLRG